jgi:spermidine synthase
MPRGLVALALALAAGSLQNAMAQTLLHKEKSLYRDIYVYESGSRRCLSFAHYRREHSRQTCMDKHEPNALIFDYTKMVMAALYLDPRPKRILVLGLGGGTLPNALLQVVPDAYVDAVEIDPAVVKVARKYFGFQPRNNLRLHVQDARVFVKRALRGSDTYDLIILDAFDHEYIPEHLLTREFLTEVRSLLRDGGVVAANTFSTSKLYDSESVTYHAVFGDFINLKRSNRVILARKGGLPPIDEIRRTAATLEEALRALDVSASWLLKLMSTRPDWDPRARLLTDQYSPSNLLNR